MKGAYAAMNAMISSVPETRSHAAGRREVTVRWGCLVRGIIIFAFGILLVPLAAVAQQPTKVPRVGILSPQKSTEPPSVQREPFERGLRELGSTPGVTILIEYRYAEGAVDRLPELAAALVRLPVDVLVTRGPQATQAARQATDILPIVMSATPDPVQAGFVASLARPV